MEIPPKRRYLSARAQGATPKKAVIYVYTHIYIYTYGCEKLSDITNFINKASQTVR